MDFGDGRRCHRRVHLAKRSGRHDGNDGSGRAGVCRRRQLCTPADTRYWRPSTCELTAPRIREGEGMIIKRINLTAIATLAPDWGNKMILFIIIPSPSRIR